MDDYMGGIAQGIRVAGTKANAVAAVGGWGELGVRASGHTQLYFGYAYDNPHADDLGKGARDLNREVWTTLSHNPGGGLRYGLEISHWETRYVQMSAGRSWRVQSSVTYSF
jgi:hypothetical protein